jgi:hypothetical protein
MQPCLSMRPLPSSTPFQRNIAACVLLLVTLCPRPFYQSPNDGVSISSMLVVVDAYDVSPPFHPNARRFRNDHFRSPVDPPPDAWAEQTASSTAPIHTADTSPNPLHGGINHVKSIWDTTAPVLVEGSSLRTWGFESMDVERVQVLLRAPPRDQRLPWGPASSSSSLVFQASVDVWHGPDNTPQRMAVYLEDNQQADYPHDDYDEDGIGGAEAQRAGSGSSSTPFTAIIETPGGYNTIAIRNTASSMDHPLLACVEADHHSVVDDNDDDDSSNPAAAYHYNSQRRTTQPRRTRGAGSGGGRRNRDNPDDLYPGGPGNNAGPVAGSALQAVTDRLLSTSTPHQVDGGGDATAYTFELAPNIASVQIMLSTDYQRPLQARIELALIEEIDEDGFEDVAVGGYQHGGSGTAHQHYHPTRIATTTPRILKRSIVEVISEDAMGRPFFAVLETPRNRLLEDSLHNVGSDSDDGDYDYCEGYDDGDDNDYFRPRRRPKLTIQMRVLNLSPSFDFPIYACVEPYVIDTEMTTPRTSARRRSPRSAASSGRRRRTKTWSHDDGHHYREPLGKDDPNNDMGDQQEILTHHGEGMDFAPRTTTRPWESKNSRHPPFGGSNGNYYNATIVDVELS